MPEPPRIRDTLKVIGRDVREIYYPHSREALGALWADFREGVASWPQERLSELWLLGERRATELGELTDLDEATRDRIAPQVAAAARSQEIRSSWIRAIELLTLRFPGLHAWMFFLYVPTIGWWIVRWAGDGAPGFQPILLAPAAGLLLWIGSRVVRLSTALLGLAADLVTKVVLAIGCAGLARRPDWWQAPLDRWQQKAEVASWESRGHSIADLKLDGTLTNALGVVCAAYTCFALYGLIVSAARVFGPREPRRDLVCAVLLDRFLEVALILQLMTDDLKILKAPGEATSSPQSAAEPTGNDTDLADTEDYEDSREDESPFAGAGTGLRPYIASAGRREFVRELESLAQFVEGRWRRAMRTGDHTGDVEVNRVADGIAARIRHWKPVAAMGGPELEDMRRAFSVAVVNIADEDWRIMAAEVSNRDLFSRRLVRWARRLAAAAVLFGTWTVLTTKSFAWVTTAYETGMAPVLYVLAAAVATTLDPATHDRVIGAIRQAGDIKAKSG
ncbi:hypothetical protein ACWGJ6_06980 [Streptomyces canus]